MRGGVKLLCANPSRGGGGAPPSHLPGDLFVKILGDLHRGSGGGGIKKAIPFSLKKGDIKTRESVRLLSMSAFESTCHFSPRSKLCLQVS